MAPGVVGSHKGARSASRYGSITKPSLPAGARAGGELFAAVAFERLATEPGEDPLREVAVQVQEQVRDAVARLVAAPPELFLRQRLDRLFDLP